MDPLSVIIACLGCLAMGFLLGNVFVWDTEEEVFETTQIAIDGKPTAVQFLKGEVYGGPDDGKPSYGIRILATEENGEDLEFFMRRDGVEIFRDAMERLLEA